MNSYYSFADGSQPKIHINLPISVWNIIYSDILDFGHIDSFHGYSNYINKIVVNYINAERYPAVISSRYVSDIPFDYWRNNILSEFSEPKEEGKKIDLTKNCLEKLSSISLIVNNEIPLIAKVFDSLGLYIRSILIHYSRQRYDIRCQIYNQNIYDKILDSVSTKRSLIVSFENNENLEIIPYGIESDSYHIHSYLIGLDPAKRNISNILLRRFSTIEQVVYGRSNCALSAFEKKTIKEQINKTGVGYLRDFSQEYTVYLTANGEKLYKNIVYQRPVHLPRTKEDIQNGIYHFVCSKYQIVNYFRRLGADAVILSPKKVHDEMLREYKKAFDAYNNPESH